MRALARHADGVSLSSAVSRRLLLRGLLVGAAAAPLTAAAACGDDEDGPVAPDAPVELSVFWSGTDARARLTEEVLALYTRKHPNVTFTKTWQTDKGYFDRLAELTAGDKAPDIFQIDDDHLAEYAARRTLAGLLYYQGARKLETRPMHDSLWRYGYVDGEFVGVPAGEDTQGLVYNRTLLTRHGLPEPTTGMTWEQHIAWAEQVTRKTKVPGTQDPSADDKALWVWLRQQGKDLYQDKGLGFTVEDVTRWFALWSGARDRGATPTPDVIRQGNTGDVTRQLVVTGRAATSWVWAGQMPDLQKSTTDELGVVAYPGDPSAQWARAGTYWSVHRRSTKKDAAVDVINFMLNDPEAVALLGTDRGLPPNADLRAKLGETVTDPTVKRSIRFGSELAKTFGDGPRPPLKGHRTVRSELVKAAENAQSGRATPARAAEQFVAAASAAIA
ncbi:extracellular solute-binding protein [Micromonospora sp. C32]|uniref:ABC transporter substrate-binding protein n=1 Tax=Micromonospora sp. C32 TaxID=2824877 RepID=UPI001B35FDE4|nr:extracellular solute-binding protein [Micromonospora sp. C32]MBQ1057240.1 extracellular solute-binding protein [Micromonospora sp. C32]